MHSLCATSTGTAEHTGVNKSLISSYVVRGVLGPFKKDGGHVAPTHTRETNHLAPETHIPQIRPFILKLGRCKTPYPTRTTQYVERCPQGLTRKRKQTKCFLYADFYNTMYNKWQNVQSSNYISLSAKARGETQHPVAEACRRYSSFAHSLREGLNPFMMLSTVYTNPNPSLMHHSCR